MGKLSKAQLKQRQENMKNRARYEIDLDKMKESWKPVWDWFCSAQTWLLSGSSHESARVFLLRVQELSELGLAAEHGQIYRCVCGKWQALPAPFEAEKEHVNVAFREVTTWTQKYCSQACLDKDPKETLAKCSD